MRIHCNTLDANRNEIMRYLQATEQSVKLRMQELQLAWSGDPTDPHLTTDVDIDLSLLQRFLRCIYPSDLGLMMVGNKELFWTPPMYNPLAEIKVQMPSGLYIFERPSPDSPFAIEVEVEVDAEELVPASDQ